jgi:hypothetical protein
MILLKNIGARLGIATYILFSTVNALAGVCDLPLAELRAKQEIVQAKKARNRSLTEYDTYVFGSRWIYQNRREPLKAEKETDLNPVAKLLFPMLIQAGLVHETPSLYGILRALHATRDRSITWIDLGGGVGVAQRKVAERERGKTKTINMINIDITDAENDPVEHKYFDDTKKREGQNIFDPQFRPTLIHDDIVKAQAPVMPDLVTSIESIQYVERKLELIVNWYNQLADHGLLIISTESPAWGSWVRDQGNSIMGEDRVFTNFVNALKAARIKCAATKIHDHEEGYNSTSTLLIVKKPGTQLKLTVDLVSTWENPYNYIASYYTPIPMDVPAVEVLTQK